MSDDKLPECPVCGKPMDGSISISVGDRPTPEVCHDCFPALCRKVFENAKRTAKKGKANADTK